MKKLKLLFLILQIGLLSWPENSAAGARPATPKRHIPRQLAPIIVPQSPKHSPPLKAQTTFNTIKELASECFNNYKEYAIPLYEKVPPEEKFTEPNIIISKEEFTSTFQKYNELMQKQKESSQINDDTPFVQKINLDPESKICFIGDIHGSIQSLLRNLLRLISLGYLKNDFSIPTDKKFYMVFTGDYVDRGRYGCEVIYTLLKLKLKNSNKVFLLRGNHEAKEVCDNYGFTKEIDEKYGEDTKKFFVDFCQNLPLALFIGSGHNPKNNDKPHWIQCCHGGIEPTLDPDYLESFLEDEATNILNLSGQIYQATSMQQKTHEALIIRSFFDDFIGSEIGLKQQQEMARNNGFTWCDFSESKINGLIYEFGRGYNINGKLWLIPQLIKYGIGAIFRGHQHYFYGLKIGGETHWTDYKVKNISLKEKAREHPNGFKISEVDFPVFTFSTASEGVALDYDCFGILTTAENWDDWRLLPFEFTLPKNRNARYVRIIEINNPDPISFKYQNHAGVTPIPPD